MKSKLHLAHDILKTILLAALVVYAAVNYNDRKQTERDAMTLHCTSTHCRIHKLCSTYKANDGGDQTIFTDHQPNMKKVSKGTVCVFFGSKPVPDDLSSIHSPNTFRTVGGGEFIIPRGIR
jgi:hypothetical protein